MSIKRNSLQVRYLKLEAVEALSNGHWPFPEPGLEGAVLPADFMRDSMLPIAKLLPEKFGCYAVLDGQVAGMGSFKGPVVDGAIEIGYGTAPAARGRGVATAITRSLVYAGLSMGAKQVIAHTDPENNASIRVLEKSAFQSQGKFCPYLQHQDLQKRYPLQPNNDLLLDYPNVPTH